MVAFSLPNCFVNMPYIAGHKMPFVLENKYAHGCNKQNAERISWTICCMVLMLLNRRIATVLGLSGWVCLVKIFLP